MMLTHPAPIIPKPNLKEIASAFAAPLFFSNSSINPVSDVAFAI